MTTLDTARLSHLDPADPLPVRVHGRNRRSPFLLLCDHAGNAVPKRLGSLGLSAEQMRMHIAWDPNAWDQTLELADLLDATAIGQGYSRLVIDCNRLITTSDSIARVSDGVVVPGNADVSREERQRRIAAFFEPYHECIAGEIDARRSRPLCIVTMHTFTPRLAGGSPRPWHIGVMSGSDGRMRKRVIERLAGARRDLTVGDNEPYIIRVEENYTLPVHAERAGVPYVQFELRNDLFGDPESRGEICALLARVLTESFADLPASGRSIPPEASR
ncbi:MAG: N-formylglutamate amidohydrolase [Parvibaculaceae bacterium]